MSNPIRRWRTHRHETKGHHMVTRAIDSAASPSVHIEMLAAAQRTQILGLGR